MEHHPGRSIVDKAAEALNAGRKVAVVINGLSSASNITGIYVEGPFAICEDGTAYWLVRLDALIGFRAWMSA